MIERRGMAEESLLIPPGARGIAWEIDMQVIVPRVSLYSGAFWESIFEGGQVRSDIMSVGQDVPIQVRRFLDDRAEHCETCPPKARIYPSYEQMVSTVGLPADGSDDCHSNCRCWIEFEDPDTGKFEGIFGAPLVPGGLEEARIG